MSWRTLYIFILLSIGTTCCENSQKQDELNKEEVQFERNPIDRAAQQADMALTSFESIAPIDVSFDTSHVKINTANFKVTLLLKNYYFLTDEQFGPREEKREDIPAFDFSESLRYRPNVTHIGDHLYFSGTVQITDSNARVSDHNGYSNFDEDTIPTIEFETFHEGGVFTMEIGELSVRYDGLSCMDTGINQPIIKNEHGILDFGRLKNLKLFEYDQNTDGEKEIYVISYATCAQFVAIYKIENSTP
ncbi:MAG: hypothetical protein GQ574_19575 [Crocinitomix sp.]|nr:hypothetical protein [Crocinitomix sp.]